MYKIIALCAFVVITFNGVWSEVCSDCMNFNNRPLALIALKNHDQATREAFRTAFCGFECNESKRIVKLKQEKTTEVIDVVANHPNLNLLPTICGAIQEQRIPVGRLKDFNEFPWMALIAHKISDDISFECGGSIINERYVLTAAHCVHGKNIAGVRVGGHDINEDYECQFEDTPIEKMIIHPDYHRWPTGVNHIALIRVLYRMDFGRRNIQPICLPNTEKLRNKSLDNVYAVVAGWGLTETGASPSTLRTSTVPIHTADTCNSLLHSYTRPGELNATASLLCAGIPDKDSCIGDPGSPLMVVETYNNVLRYLQYGVVSFAGRRCGVDFPGVYTGVTKFMGWILDNMAP